MPIFHAVAAVADSNRSNPAAAEEILLGAHLQFSSILNFCFPKFTLVGKITLALPQKCFIVHIYNCEFVFNSSE